MSDSDAEFTGSIPEVYDSHLVPIIFEGYARNLAERVADQTPTSVLEIAAGSGVVARALAPLLQANTQYVVTDLNGAMIDQARKRLPGAKIDWQVADALDLPFEDDSFDIVLCQFGVMFFPDRVTGLSEARRVLRPGGRLIFSCWGPIERNEFSKIAIETVMALYPQDPPLFLARTPYGYWDKSRIKSDLVSAGFAEVQIEEVELESEAEKAEDFAFGQIFGSPLGLEIEARDGPTKEQVREAIGDALASRFGAGHITGRMMALVTEAIAP